MIFNVCLPHQWDVRAGPLCGWPPGEQPKAPGGGEEDEAGAGRDGGEQSEAGRGERGAATQGPSVRRVCQQRGVCAFRRWRLGSVFIFLSQEPAAGSEGKAAEGGGGGDEGHPELHRERQSPRLRTQQTRGQSESTGMSPEFCFSSRRHVRYYCCICAAHDRKEILSALDCLCHSVSTLTFRWEADFCSLSFFFFFFSFQETENQSLIAKIASLQEEVPHGRWVTCLSRKRYPNSPLMAAQNFRVTVEMDGLQKRITELCDINADLQVSFYNSRLCVLEFIPASLCSRTVLLSFFPSFFSFHALPSSQTDLLFVDRHGAQIEILCTLFFPLCNFPFFFHRCRFTRLMPLLMKRELRYKRSVLCSHFSWFCPSFKAGYYELDTGKQILLLICCSVNPFPRQGKHTF